MFVPRPYREPGTSWMFDLIRNNPLALMATNGTAETGPFATHLPVILDPTTPEEPVDGLVGVTLLGHMNKVNPQWRALRSGGAVLLSFTGPHAYVSPTVYGVTPAAPTWNFTSVHVRGTVHKFGDVEETMSVVQATVTAYEKGFGTGWDMTESLGYFRRIAPGVGAFRVTVTAADGMFKLSQEQQPEIRARVRQSFGESECTRHRDTAELMSRLP